MSDKTVTLASLVADLRRKADAEPAETPTPPATPPATPAPAGGTGAITPDFVTAGKAIFTVANPAGERYTFRINFKPADDKWAAKWFIALLTGPNNESDYTYLGMLEPYADADAGRVRLTGKSRYADDAKPVRVLRWLLGKVWRGESLPAGYAVNHEGFCCRCGRLLTVPESVASGIGPECAKMGGRGGYTGRGAPAVYTGRPMRIGEVAGGPGGGVMTRRGFSTGD